VSAVSSGQEAVDAAASGAFDLILMDCMMPEMDGYEASRQIRAAGGTAPIVALTASVFAEERSACLEAGMIDVLSKPVTSEDIVDIIEKYVH
jgi:CheY-like chemotaxis protein